MQSIRNSDVLKLFSTGLLAVALAPAAAIGQDAGPRPVEQVPPEPPLSRFDLPMEGLAIVRYSVRADGGVDRVRVVDSIPAQLPERELRVAVERWTFEPVIRDGAAVPWHSGESVLVLDSDIVPPEPRPMFVAGYREVETLLTDGEYEDAERRSRRLVETEASRLAEIGVALVQNARVHMVLNNPHEAFASIRWATDPRISLLEPSELAVALEYRNRLELVLGDVVGALDTFARRESLGTIPEADIMASNLERIRAALAGDAAIAVQGKILDDVWSHQLERRTFAVGDVDGNLRGIDVECDLNTAEFEFSDESEFTLPESWGACRVLVTGRRDSEFVLYEFR